MRRLPTLALAAACLLGIYVLALRTDVEPASGEAGGIEPASPPASPVAASAPGRRVPALAHTEVVPDEALAFVGGVRDRAGRPVADARVLLLREDEVVSESRSDADGAFRIRTQSAGVFHLHASQERVGRAERRVVRRAGRCVDLGALVLHPAGVIAGCMCFPDGSPVPDAAVSLLSLDEDGGGFGVRSDHVLRTDSLGRFRTATLQGSRYLVNLSDSPLPSWPAVHEDAPIYPVGSEDILLRVAAIRLRVGLRSASKSEPREEARSQFFEFSEGNLPVVAAALSSEGPSTELRSRASISSTGFGPECMWVEEFPRLYLFRMRWADRCWSDRVVFLRGLAPPYDREIWLEPRPEIEWCTATLRVRDENGQPVTGPLVALVEAKDPRHLGLCELMRLQEESAVGIRVPSGLHELLVLCAEPSWRHYCTSAEFEHRFAPGPVEVVPVELKTLGRVRLDLRGLPPHTASIHLCDVVSLSRPGHPEPLWSWAWGPLEAGKRARLVELRRDTKLLLPPLLEPGRWTVQVRVPGMQPWSGPVDVPRGAAGDCVVTLVSATSGR